MNMQKSGLEDASFCLGKYFLFIGLSVLKGLFARLYFVKLPYGEWIKVLGSDIRTGIEWAASLTRCSPLHGWGQVPSAVTWVGWFDLVKLNWPHPLLQCLSLHPREGRQCGEGLNSTFLNLFINISRGSDSLSKGSNPLTSPTNTSYNPAFSFYWWKFRYALQFYQNFDSIYRKIIYSRIYNM